ncbi:TldD/PmbA family protein [Mycoplasmatota bacterium zrk1]
MNIFNVAKQKGIEDLELYTSKSQGKNISALNGTVESYQISNQDLLSVRGIIDGKMGYVYTEDLNENTDELLNRLIDNAKIVSSPDVEEIFSGSDEYTDLGEISSEVVEHDEIISMVELINKTAKEFDSKISDTNIVFIENTNETKIQNSKNLKLEKKDKHYILGISTVGLLGEQKSSAFEFEVVKYFKDFNPKKIALDSAKAAVAELGAGPCKSGSYPIVLKNTAGSEILSAIRGMFYAENVQKGLSPLKDKLNEKITGGNISIVDDPFIKVGMNRSSFDDEGVSTSVTTLIENGNLNSYLHNLKSSKIDKVESTGNGFKASVQSKVGTSTTNLYIKENDSSFESLFEGIKKGVYITRVAGTHSGINGINGDFSLQSQGFMIEDGKITTPVRLITIAGNYFDMLSKVEKIANDMKFNLTGVGAPSMLIKELPVSGK